MSRTVSNRHIPGSYEGGGGGGSLPPSLRAWSRPLAALMVAMNSSCFLLQLDGFFGGSGYKKTQSILKHFFTLN